MRFAVLVVLCACAPSPAADSPATEVPATSSGSTESQATGEPSTETTNAVVVLPQPSPGCSRDELAAVETDGGALELVSYAMVPEQRFDDATELVVPCANMSEAECEHQARAGAQDAHPSAVDIRIEVTEDAEGMVATYRQDGGERTMNAPDADAVAARLRALQAAGHEVMLLSFQQRGLPETRHAVVTIALSAPTTVHRMHGELRLVPTPGMPISDALRAMNDAFEETSFQLRLVEPHSDHVAIEVDCGETQ